MKLKNFLEKVSSNLIYSLKFSVLNVILIIEGHVKTSKIIKGGIKI